MPSNRTYVVLPAALTSRQPPFFRWVGRKSNTKQKGPIPSQTHFVIGGSGSVEGRFHIMHDIVHIHAVSRGSLYPDNVCPTCCASRMTRKRSRTRVIREASYQQAQDHSKRFPVCIDPSTICR
jgi:hypothetical protein